MRRNNSGSLWEEYLKRARRALYDGEPEIAITHADQVLQADPDNLEAKRIQEEAIALQARTRGRFKSLVGKLGAKAAKAAGLGKKAIDELQMQHRADPTEWRAAIAYAEACVDAGRAGEGGAAAVAALPTNQTNERFLERAADLFHIIGDVEHEVAVLRCLRDFRQNDPALDRRLRNAEASLLYQRESKHKPTESRAEVEKQKQEAARAKDLQTRIEQAVKVYKDHPEDMRNRVWLARLLLQSGSASDLTDAQHILEQIMEEDAENGDALRVLADMHRSQGHLAEAVELFEKLAALRPDDLDLQKELLQVREEHYSARVEEDPDDAEAKAELDEIRQIRREREIEELEQRVKVNPNDPDLVIELGDKYREHGRLDDAIGRYQAAARSPLRRFRASMRLGEAFVVKQKPELAILQFEKALESAPAASHGLSEQRKRALYALGRIHEDMDNTEAALKCYQELYAEDIGFEDVAERFEAVYAAKQERDRKSEAS